MTSEISQTSSFLALSRIRLPSLGSLAVSGSQTLQQQSDTYGLDLIYRDEQLAAAIVQKSQLVEAHRPAIDNFRDDRANKARALRRINNFIPNGQ